MRKIKKGDGMATILITIVLIAIILLIVPALKNIQKDNSKNAENTAQAGQSIVSNAVDISKTQGYDKVN